MTRGLKLGLTAPLRALAEQRSTECPYDDGTETVTRSAWPVELIEFHRVPL